MSKQGQNTKSKDSTIKEQFNAYLEHIISQSICSIVDEVRLDNPATVAVEFEMSLAVAMGGSPFFAGPTTCTEEYKLWKNEGVDKYSEGLIALRDEPTDSFVDRVTYIDMVDERLSSNEESIVRKTLINKNTKSISKLFVTSILDLVKRRQYRNHANVETYKIIDRFLSYWGRILLIQEHQRCLGDLARFMSGDYDGFENGKKLLKGFPTEKIITIATFLKRQKNNLS